ncbi:unnamed protein product [Darwinula stevensoni]|uniref:Kringle domain-containing protein n=1 Tax=Darwinula stevensoni TaxID=69355 RepID=A0A7R9AF79_9CRUS|nr:unnamed protein product [Darwinula stevensoni]CAG0903001.1 unnamed protein product [Darwinula stevensoni]
MDAWSQMNYCRNPSGREKPWCFIDDSETQWDYCDIPTCEDPGESLKKFPGLEIHQPPECKVTEMGGEYIGRKNVSLSGDQCKPWKEWIEGDGTYKRIFPDLEGMDEQHNFCRNPYGEFDVPFCYVWDTVIEACDIPFCPEEKKVREGAEGTNYPECLLSEKGKEYVGTMSVTETGKACLSWAEQADDMPWDFYMRRHPDSDFSSEYTGYDKNYLFLNGDAKMHKNYCRNPGPHRKRPWCFISDVDIKWEYCDIPFCHDMNPPNCKLTGRGGEYVGNKKVTMSGKPCQPWVGSFTIDERPNYAETSTFPEEIDSTDNFCRNPRPSTIRSPWCFVEPGLYGEWEYCDVPFCPTSDGEECDIRIKGECVSEYFIELFSRLCAVFLPRSVM